MDNHSLYNTIRQVKIGSMCDFTLILVLPQAR